VCEVDRPYILCTKGRKGFDCFVDLLGEFAGWDENEGRCARGRVGLELLEDLFENDEIANLFVLQN
jgi:hypothetical protein